MHRLERLQLFADMERTARLQSSIHIEVSNGLITLFPSAPDYETSIAFYESGWVVSDSVYSEPTYDRWDLSNANREHFNKYCAFTFTEAADNAEEVAVEAKKAKLPWVGLRRIWEKSLFWFSVDGMYYRENLTTNKWEVVGNLDETSSKEWERLKEKEKHLFR